MKEKIAGNHGREPTSATAIQANAVRIPLVLYLGAFQRGSLGECEFDSVGENTRPMSNAQTFEQSLSRLEEVVARLEGGELPLDEALERYEEGVRLVSRCRTDLERAELKVRRLVERNGSPEVEDVTASGLFGGAAG